MCYLITGPHWDYKCQPEAFDIMMTSVNINRIGLVLNVAYRFSGIFLVQL